MKKSLSPSEPAAVETFIALLRILTANTTPDVSLVILNDLRQIIFSEQSVLIQESLLQRPHILGVSNLTEVEQTSAHSIWIKGLYKSLPHNKGPIQTSNGALGDIQWGKFAPSNLLFLPLNLRGGLKGGILMFRKVPWTDEDIKVLSLVGDVAATRLGFLSRPELGNLKAILSRKKAVVALFLLIVFIFPVRLVSVAPAEIVPLEPLAVASSVQGVVRKVRVQANSSVVKGQLLVELDDTDQKSRVEVARQEVEVAQTELKRIGLMGFQDPSMRFRISELEGLVQIKQLELERALGESQRTRINADRDGIAIVSDTLDWEGKPVQVGERILMIADPSSTAIRVSVPAQDGPVLAKETEGKLYLDSEPWTGRRLRVSYWVFEPEVTPQAIVAYRVIADWMESDGSRRIGLRGTAHLYGPRLPLILFVLRRPIIWLRQTFSL